MNAKTLEAVRRHGECLLAAFPNATEKDPVALCKKLRRVENSLNRALTDVCNGDFQDDKEGARLDALTAGAILRVRELLGLNLFNCRDIGLFVNRDPRGYALKLNDDWTRRWNDKNYSRIYTDLGGYGILAPDLTCNS